MMSILEKKIKNMNNNLTTPVVFIIFNRPDTTDRVFGAIREAKPEQLFVVADGPRSDYPQDIEKCRDARTIIEDVDWDCKVFTNFSDTNLGCKKRVSTGLDWVFETVEEAIILEDDCYPSQSFFYYCQELLERYRTDERIMLVSGYNSQGIWKVDAQDYFFSNFGGIWGWASWRRAWKYYDGEMKDLDVLLKNKNLRHILGEKTGRVREKQFINVIEKQIDSWAYPWALSRHVNSGMATVPTKSLIENIGFGADATHTVIAPQSHVINHEITFPLKENRIIVADAEYDALFHPSKTLLKRILNKLKRIWEKLI